MEQWDRNGHFAAVQMFEACQEAQPTQSGPGDAGARKLLLRNNLASAIICLFDFQGWGDGHGRHRAQANPSLSLSRMSVT